MLLYATGNCERNSDWGRNQIHGKHSSLQPKDVQRYWSAFQDAEVEIQVTDEMRTSENEYGEPSVERNE